MIRHFLAAAGGIFVLFLVFATLDQGEKTILAWAQYRAFVADACEPTHPGQLAISRISADGKLNCQIQENVGYGRAPAVVSDAVLEVPR